MSRRLHNSVQIDTANAGVGAGPISLATSFVTLPTVVTNFDNCSYQINVATVDSTGVFTVQVSNDYRKGSVAGTWTNLTLSGAPVTAGANDSIAIHLEELPFYAMRLSYTPSTAGTGTCTVFLSNKSVGA